MHPELHWCLPVFKSIRRVCCTRDQFSPQDSTRGAALSQHSWTAICYLGKLGSEACTRCFGSTFPQAGVGQTTLSQGFCGLCRPCVLLLTQAHPCSCPRYGEPSVVFSPSGVYPVLFLKVYCIETANHMLKFYYFQILIGILQNICAIFLETCIYCEFLLFLEFLPAI